MKLKSRISVVKLLIALSLYGIQCSEYAHQQLKNISFDQQSYHKKGLISLAFVFDRTGSMYDDLVKVREGATKIFNNTIDNGKPLVNNYILVPFSDPGSYGLNNIYPILITLILVRLNNFTMLSNMMLKT